MLQYSQLFALTTALFTSWMSSPVLAYDWPRMDFDMDPVAAIFAGFCAVLFVLLLGSLITLGLFKEEQKRESMYHSAWAGDEEDDDDVEPFVSEDEMPQIGADAEAETTDVKAN